MQEILGIRYSPIPIAAEKLTSYSVEMIIPRDTTETSLAVVNCMAELTRAGMVMQNDNLEVMEGIDGSGKSSQALIRASALRDRGHKVIVLRGSGTTGVQELIAWSNHTIPNSDGDKTEILADLGMVLAIQQAYTACDEATREGYQQKMKAGVSMQVLMFDLINKYLYKKEDYRVISDRGIISTLSGIYDKAPQYFAQLVQQSVSLLKEVPGVATSPRFISTGRNVLIDVPVEVSFPRVIYKDHVLVGVSDRERKILREQLERRANFLTIFEALRKTDSRMAVVVDGNGTQAEVARRIAVHLK